MKTITTTIAALLLAGCVNQSAWDHASNHEPEVNRHDGPGQAAYSAPRETGIESMVTRETRNGTTTISWNEPLRSN